MRLTIGRGSKVQFLINDNDLQRDIAVNLSTEAIGVVVSVFLSIIFARWLDERAQRRIFRNRAVALQKHLLEVHNFLTVRALTTSRYKKNEPHPIMGLHHFRMDYSLLRADFENYWQNVRVDYSHLISDDSVVILEHTRRNLDRCIACFGLQSAQFRKNVADGLSIENIARDQAHWAIKIIERLEDSVNEFENKISWLRNSKLQSDKDELLKEYEEFFLPFIPIAIEQLQEL